MNLKNRLFKITQPVSKTTNPMLGDLDWRGQNLWLKQFEGKTHSIPFKERVKKPDSLGMCPFRRNLIDLLGLIRALVEWRFFWMSHMKRGHPKTQITFTASNISCV
jgi:hypothetical protein